MSDIHILRHHALGLTEARAIAARWVHEAQTRFDLTCTVLPGDACDTIEFKRSGVSGRIEVAADRFELTAKLGFLLSGFRAAITAQIEKNLDQLLKSG